jgi:hypothetical protein
MTTTASGLREIANAARTKLLAISPEQAAVKPYAEKWSIKEILGHMTDSAANNHQRIVRMQEVENIGIFKYSQQHWVSAQHYQEEPWTELVEFWYSYNKHLAYIIEHVDPAAMNHGCDMGYDKPATLKFVIGDYIRHVEHHLRQIFENPDPLHRDKWVRRTPDF